MGGVGEIAWGPVGNAAQHNAVPRAAISGRKWIRKVARLMYETIRIIKTIPLLM